MQSWLFIGMECFLTWSCSYSLKARCIPIYLQNEGWIILSTDLNSLNFYFNYKSFYMFDIHVLLFNLIIICGVRCWASPFTPYRTSQLHIFIILVYFDTLSHFMGMTPTKVHVKLTRSYGLRCLWKEKWHLIDVEVVITMSQSISNILIVLSVCDVTVMLPVLHFLWQNRPLYINYWKMQFRMHPWRYLNARKEWMEFSRRVSVDHWTQRKVTVWAPIDDRGR
jgi:hypothetical protein